MRIISKLAIMLLALSAVSLIFARDTTTLPPILRAAEIAYYDYEHKLLVENFNNNSPFAKYAKNMSNYEITVKEDSGFYIVIFSLRAPPGEMISGGPDEYKIDQNFKILNIRRFK